MMSWIAEYGKGIREAYAFLREKNSTIPDEVLKFMLDASLEKLDKEQRTCSRCGGYMALYGHNVYKCNECGAAKIKEAQ